MKTKRTQLDQLALIARILVAVICIPLAAYLYWQYNYSSVTDEVSIAVAETITTALFWMVYLPSLLYIALWFINVWVARWLIVILDIAILVFLVFNLPLKVLPVLLLLNILEPAALIVAIRIRYQNMGEIHNTQ